MIYLDNAATTYPKPESVYEAMNDCMRNYCANPGRSGHKMAYKSAMVVEETRDKLAKLFNIKNPDRKSTRLNSSHANISYAVFCLKKKKLYPPSCVSTKSQW